MEIIIPLSANTNWGYNTRNEDLFIKSGTELYNYIHRKGASLLTKIVDSSELQQIGKAFSYFARFVDNGYNANSVSAENAFYCLAKSVKLGNFYAAPELYNLINDRYVLLIDKLVYTMIRDIQDNSQVPIPPNYIFGFGSPTENPDARNEAKNLIPFLKFYIISQFYDIEKNETRMPSDIIEYSKSSVSSDLGILAKKSDPGKSIKMGEKYFNYMINEIEETLSNY